MSPFLCFPYSPVFYSDHLFNDLALPIAGASMSFVVAGLVLLMRPYKKTGTGDRSQQSTSFHYMIHQLHYS